MRGQSTHSRPPPCLFRGWRNVKVLLSYLGREIDGVGQWVRGTIQGGFASTCQQDIQRGTYLGGGKQLNWERNLVPMDGGWGSEDYLGSAHPKNLGCPAVLAVALRPSPHARLRGS